MKHHFKLFSPTWAALAASALIAACGGGGSAGSPTGSEDTTPPTVAITAAANSEKNVVFTFNFDEPVSGFTIGDVDIDVGTKGEFNMAINNRSATLVVIPPADSEGTIRASVIAGAFSDFAENKSVAAANTSQAFNTKVTPPPVSNLLPNGNFENGTTGWTGNARDVRTENGNSYNFANVAAAGQAYEANLSYLVNIPAQNVCYKLTFSASTSTERAERKLIAGIGLNQFPWDNKTQEVTLTSVLQTFELPLISNFADASSRVIFDMGHDTGVVVIDNVKLEIDENACSVAPPSAFSPLTFDDSNTTYTFTGFGGTDGDNSRIAVDPTNNSNKVGRAIKPNDAQEWAGTTISTGSNFSVGTIPFSNSQSRMTLRVYSPVANIPVRLKVENAADPTKSVETEATVTQANTWQTLTFNFANQASGTAALNLSTTYNKASVFFNFGTKGVNGGGGTFYFDDLSMGN